MLDQRDPQQRKLQIGGFVDRSTTKKHHKTEINCDTRQKQTGIQPENDAAKPDQVAELGRRDKQKARSLIAAAATTTDGLSDDDDNVALSVQIKRLHNDGGDKSKSGLTHIRE